MLNTYRTQMERTKTNNGSDMELKLGDTEGNFKSEKLDQPSDLFYKND